MNLSDNAMFTTDEIMVVCISRLIEDNEVVVQGIATPLITAAFLLAKRTHAPNLYFASAIGQGISFIPAPMGLTYIEAMWLSYNMRNIGFTQVAQEFLPWQQPKEFFRPAQVDQYGNFNNIAFGSNYAHPRFRLPGSGGIPDVTVFSKRNYLYVTRHSRLTFVPKLDFISGLGHSPERTHGMGPHFLVSDLGQFDFENKRMRLKSFHPGIPIEHIQSRTGFPLEIIDDVQETPLPSLEEISILRNEVDPFGIRRLELSSGSERRELLHKIITSEKLMSFNPDQVK
jgi:glutaconate CoA-transferase subunit B